jgi:hypothetical protein
MHTDDGAVGGNAAVRKRGDRHPTCAPARWWPTGFFDDDGLVPW